MKKGLSLLLAASMAFSAFAGAASADNHELTTQEKFDALVKAGIFTGLPGGDAGLDQKMTRAQVAAVIQRLLGLEQDADEANASFKDLTNSQWAAGYIGAVNPEYMKGYGGSKFGPSDTFTYEQLAAVLVRVLDLEIDEEATVDGTVSDWAKAYVAAAVAAGLIAPQSDYKANALRGALVEAAYTADSIIIDVTAEATVNADNTVTIEGETEAEEVTVQVYANGDTSADPVVDTTEAVTDGAYEFTTGVLPAGTHLAVVRAGDYMASAEFTIEAPDYAAKVVGAKKIEVQFGKAVDTSKTVIALKKGTTPINIAKTTFAEDKTSAVIETSTNLTEGDYTVTTTGVAAEALTATVKAENQRIAKIEFQSDKAAIVRGSSNTQIDIFYTITNQYGENVNSQYEGGVTFTYTKGNTGATGSSGKLTLTAATYSLNESVTVYALHNSGAFAQQTFTVSPTAQVADIQIKGLYNKDGKTPTQGDNPANYYIEVVAKDQYGRDVPEASIDDDVLVTVSNTGIFNVASTFAKVDDRVTLQLAAPTATPAVTTLASAGKSTVLIMSKTTGKQAQLEVTVAESKKVASLTLSAPEIAVAGEEIKIPFTALDQSGNPIEKTKDLALLQAVTLRATGLPDLTWKPDYVNDKVELVLNAASAASNTSAQNIFVTGTAGNSLVQLQLTLQTKATPQVITGIDGLTSAIAEGGSVKIANDKIKVLDQYNRSKTLKDFAADYVVEFKSSAASKISFASGSEDADAVVNSGTTSATLYGRAAGSATITAKLYKGSVAEANEVKNGDYTFSATTVTVADITGYDVSVASTVYAGGANYAKELKIEGVLANGSKVALPIEDADYYTVVESVYGIDVAANGDGDKLLVTATAVDATDDRDILAIDNGKEKSFAITIIGKTKDGGTSVVGKEVKVSRIAPEITTLELKDGTDVKKVADGVLKVTQTFARTGNYNGIATQGIKVVDQYGVEMTGSVFASVTATGVQDNLPANLDAGESFTLTIVTTNGKPLQVKVLVVNAV